MNRLIMNTIKSLSFPLIFASVLGLNLIPPSPAEAVNLKITVENIVNLP